MSENYKGSIELISGLIQKNKGDFPLMEASAVAFYEDGQEIRLPEKLKSVGISQDEKDKIVTSAVEKAHTNTTIKSALEDMDKNSEDVLALNKEVDTINNRLTIAEKGDNDKLKVTYNEEVSMLYLHTGDEVLEDASNVISQTVIKGGGGGSSTSYKLILQQDDEKTALSVLKGRPAEINFTPVLTNIEDGSPANNEKITLYLYVNDALKGTYTKRSNEKSSLDISEFLMTGFNTVKLTASYSEVIMDTGAVVTSRSSRSWSFDVIEMYLKSNFSDATVKEVAAIGEKVTYTFTPYGNLEKTIYFKLNNEVVGQMVTSDSDRSKSFDLAVPGHGAYSLEVWCTGVVEGETIESEHLFYNVMFAIVGNNDPIVRMLADSLKGQQYSTSTIKYTVYKANSVNNKIVLKVNDVAVNEVTVDRTEQSWLYKPTDYGTKKLSIFYNDIEYNSITLEIAKFPYEINPITAKLDLDFNPAGRTNQDLDYNTFKNNVYDEEGNEKPLTWTLSDNFDWVNGGWQVDEDDNTYFCVKAGTKAIINYNMFADPNIVLGADGAMGNGKEFKMIFKTTNVANINTTFLKCLALPTTGLNEVGLEMKAHHGYVKSNSATLEIPYAEEDIVEFDFNINPAKVVNGVIETTGEIIPMVLSYEDGVPFLPMTYTSTETSFTQNTPVPIEIGSTDCDVHIYRMKCYSSYLTNEDVLNNYIADASSGEEISNRFLRNQIYINGALTPEGLALARPDLKIIKIRCPYFTNDKDNFVGNTSVEMIHTNGDPALDNWTFSNGFHSGQGTSSNKYGDAGRNIDLLMCFDGNYKHKKILKMYEGREDEYWAIRSTFKSKDGTINITDGTGKIGLSRTSVPTSYFNIKVNIASSENANNALIANRYDRFLPYTSVGKKRDPFVKNTMEFVNCVVFLQEYDDDLSKHREFQDKEWHFYAIGNIGDSKKTDQTRAYDPDDHKEFVVEIMDNNMPNAAFQTGFVDEENSLEIKYPILRSEWVEGNSAYDALYSDKWDGKTSFEMRYEHPDASDEQSEANIAKWNEFYEWVIMASDEEFKTKLKNWVNLPAAYYYYLFTERYTMMDNRAKNSFWHWSKLYITQAEVTQAATALTQAQTALEELLKAEVQDEEAIAAAQALVEEKEALHKKMLCYTIDDAESAINEGYRFDWWDYDNDTSLGIDNSGTLRMPYGKEDIDTEVKEDGTINYYFNAGNSVFYRRLRKLFPDELRTAYNQAEESQCFSAENLIQEFDAWQAEFPEAIWIQDYERKYARTYRNGTPDHLNKRYTGRKKFHRRQWERDQEGYMASKYRAASTQSGIEDGKPVQYQILMRCKTPSGVVVPPKYEMDIIPYSDMYLNVQFGPNYIETVRAKAGETYTIKSPFEDMTDNQVAVFSGKRIQSIGDISTFYPSEGTFSTGEKLKTLIIGNGTPGYANSYLTTLTTSAKNKMLEYLDIQNLTSLKTVYLQIQNLKHFFAQGSGITEAVFANNGLLEEAHLPASMAAVVANNLYYLRDLTFEGYDSLNKVVFNNCPNVDVLDIVTKAKNLKIARLIDISWHLEDTTLLNRLAKCIGVQADGNTQTEHSILTGYVYVDAIRQTELDLYKSIWPELEVHYGRIITQWTLTFYNEGADIYSDAPLYSYKVDTNTVLYPEIHDPVKNGTISAPTKADSIDGQYSFVFEDWNPSMEPTITAEGNEQYITVTSDMTFFATYRSETRKYMVTWYGYNRQILQQSEVAYGEDGIYEGPIPTRTNQTDAYFLFGGWDNSSANITQNKEIAPIWLEANPGAPSTFDSTKLSPVEVYSLAQYTKDTGYNYSQFDKYIGTDKEITVQMGYMPEFDNIESKVFNEAIKKYTGLKTDVVDTGIKLFNPNQNFTLAIDFTPGYQDTSIGTKASNTIVSCYDEREYLGFRLNNPGHVPSIQWHDQSALPLYPNNPNVTTPTEQFREICVIRYEAQSKTLYFYSNNRFSLDDVYERSSSVSVLWNNFDATLMFGGLLAANTPHYATGEIHYAKLWYGDLGAEECKKICSWTYDTLTFEQVGTQRYNYSTIVDGVSKNLSTTASFLATELLEKPMPIYNGSYNNNLYPAWSGASLREWMNTKVLKGFSPEWQQILQPTVIYSLGKSQNASSMTGVDNHSKALQYYSRTSTVDKLYIPALAEIDPDPSEYSGSAEGISKYQDEKGPNKDNLQSYPQFNPENQSSRIKKMKGSNKDAAWWTRTPNLNNPKYQRAVAPDGGYGTSGMYYQLEGDSTYYWFTPTEKNNCGVLLAFSI